MLNLTVAPKSLEIEFNDLFTLKTDINDYCEFKDYLQPNEHYPENIEPHLTLMEEGIIVSTGAERSFFDLIFCNPLCKGIVVVDLNPRVKAYVDFNTLLLRISENKEDYLALSKSCDNIKQRVKQIAKKIANLGLLDKILAYYKDHLKAFSSIYYGQFKTWKEQKSFKNCKYHTDDILFSKLSKFAKAGNIISVVRNINNLQFLRDRKISIVDTSNISDESFLEIVGDGDFHPRVITTSVRSDKALYFSYVHEMLDQSKKNEIDQLIKSILLCKDIAMNIFDLKNIFVEEAGLRDIFHWNCITIYSEKTLVELNKFIDKHIIEIPGANFFLYDYLHTNLYRASEDDIDALCKHEKINDHLEFLVGSWEILELSIYSKFRQINAWIVLFEEIIIKNPANCENLINRFGKKDFYDIFSEYKI